MASPIVRTERLTRSFGSLMAVARVDFSVERGELRSIIGPNGAGKTTFFRLISGEMEPTAGRIFFDGNEITGLPQHRVSRLGVAKSYQITNIFPHLAVLENVRVAAQTYRLSFDFWGRAESLTGVRDKAGAILKQVGLVGQARRCWRRISPTASSATSSSAIALATDPTLLLLDEPTAGMSPRRRTRPSTLIREHRARAHRHPDRAQDEGRHEHLRPHHRAAPGRRSWPRAAPPRFAPTRASSRRTWVVKQ